MQLTDWWGSAEWLAYERACGKEGDRVRKLASATWETRVLDLCQDEAALWRGVRQSYHALVNRLTADPMFGIVACAPSDIVKVCLPLHTREAGRQTRPLASWEIQAEWIRSGLASGWIAFRIEHGAQVPVGFCYVLTVGTWAYYASSATTERNVQHALQWKAILSLKEEGITTYELGWQGEASDDKGRGIEFFRRGFGGTDVSVFRDPGLAERPTSK